MTRRYFGTDGIRGLVGTAPMTVDFALRLASAAARVLAPQGVPFEPLKTVNVENERCMTTWCLRKS